MKKKVKDCEWHSGVNPKSSMSYEKYIKSSLEMMHRNLSVRVYKLAPKDIYPAFMRGKDLRVGFFWKGKPIIDSTLSEPRNYEFIVEQPFWYQSCKNKEDRQYMRDHAHMHLKVINDGLEAGRKKYLEEKNKEKPVKSKKKKSKAGTTQDLLENFKKK